ncbi:hypothetical protein K443DRAFT_192639 [Laccaria amethystina LaAM-08-1]|uniref:Uncharacterized protein n=1 Tax=Laccaria amethystina LaAM-08-1 TaxID=1095629 RepID=A0A0C9XSR4_9AGAR|nr:hypothetical protein K443DRAFT_192639 [Laccaria amethystina LaAM-08-1]
MATYYLRRRVLKIEGPATLLDSGRKFFQLAQHAFCKLPQERFIFLTHHTAFLFPHATRYNPKATLKSLLGTCVPANAFCPFSMSEILLSVWSFGFLLPHLPSNLVCRSSVCDLSAASENSHYHPPKRR